MAQLIDDAADALERRLFFDDFSARYEALRADSVAWGAIESERALESGAPPNSPDQEVTVLIAGVRLARQLAAAPARSGWLDE